MAEEVLDLTLSDDEDAVQFPAPVPSVKLENPPRDSKCDSEAAATPAPKFNNDGASKLTTVSGKGVWKSWTRNFKNTLLKLLDIVDNAVDGATNDCEAPDFAGRVRIYPDTHRAAVEHRNGKRTRLSTTTGLCIRNNSPRKIVPLSEALVVHKTTKLDAGEIGENGVGLKQACAALCDLSFVLVRDGTSGTVELGVIAKSLQREEGPYLPAFLFSLDKAEKEDRDASLRKQMASLFSQPKHGDVARCIAQYGAEASGGRPSVASGIDVLCRRFEDMRRNFHGNDHVFEVILLLNKVRCAEDGGPTKKRALDVQQKITVNNLLKDLRREIPKTYLHLPKSFEFVVDNEKLKFNYWMERLVELSTYSLFVGRSVLWSENFEHSNEHPDAYALRLYMGFDRRRIAESDVAADTGEKMDGKNASLYIYSRRLGRLIKSVSDARQMLGLTTGSSNYGAALTIVIDDIDGCLPLNPTKQDVAFGLENKGAIHEENLFAWVSSVTKFFYNYHLKKYNKAKKVLTAKVSHHVDGKPPTEMKSYRESNFTTFNLTFEQYRGTIRVDARLAKEIIGEDTYFRLLPEPSDFANVKEEEKKRSCSKSQKKQLEKQSDDELSSSSPDNDKEGGVKKEGHGKGSNDSEVVDLCESSDKEEDPVCRDKPLDNDMQREEELVGEQKSSQPDTAKESRVRELEQAIWQLKEEREISKSTITTLERENRYLKEQLLKEREGSNKTKSAITALVKETKELKEQLLRKERVISVLKRR